MEMEGNLEGVFAAFYGMLQEMTESYRHNPVAATTVVFDNDSQYYDRLMASAPTVHFSGEECYGRYVDLHEFYNRYINAKFGRYPLEYTAYLDQVTVHLDDVPMKLKGTREYVDYVSDLLEYLVSFVERSQPLMGLDRVLLKVETEFEKQYGCGDETETKTKTKTAKRKREALSREDIVQVMYEYYGDKSATLEELMELGPSKLKEALASLGLKSGGTVRQRALRLLLVILSPPSEIEAKHFAKASEDQKVSKRTALMEAKLKKLCEILKETIDRTRERVWNRQGMSLSELLRDREDDDMVAYDIYGDDLQEIQSPTSNHNPLKLPMGWDGKPIPYWLYKLHGLGQEFKCQICGDHSYWGRRAFEKHFKERRHQHGMRCLGIPNTKSFNEITDIADAKKLWQEIQHRQRLTMWQSDIDEEFEDEDGNIYNKKTFTDLTRQGLIVVP